MESNGSLLLISGVALKHIPGFKCVVHVTCCNVIQKLITQLKHSALTKITSNLSDP